MLNLTNYRSYIFDFDGVLFDTREANICAYNEALRAMGYPIAKKELESTFGWPVETLLEKLGLRLTKAQQNELKMRKRRTYPKYFQRIQQNLGLFDLIAEAHKMEVPMVICSSAQGENVRNVLEHFTASHFFKGIIAREQVKKPKPSPEPYEKCLRLLNCPAEECIVFEDHPVGVESAHQVGLKVIGVGTFLNQRDRDALESTDIYSML